MRDHPEEDAVARAAEHLLGDRLVRVKFLREAGGDTAAAFTSEFLNEQAALCQRGGCCRTT